jgi:hypothetical protein
MLKLLFGLAIAFILAGGARRNRPIAPSSRKERSVRICT